MTRGYIISIVIVAVVMGVLLIPHMLGITLGQKCTKMGFIPDSPNWHACIARLNRGVMP